MKPFLFTLIAFMALARLAISQSISEQPRMLSKDISKSKPVQMNGFEFVAITKSKWQADPSAKGEIPVAVQLLITNRTPKDMLFRVFDTFSLVIKNAEGIEMPSDSGRDATFQPPPVAISAGKTYSLDRKATLKSAANGHGVIFSYSDGTGSWFFCPLAPGKYRLSFLIGSQETDEDREVSKKESGVSALPPAWEGQGVTPEVSFEVVGPSTDAGQ